MYFPSVERLHFFKIYVLSLLQICFYFVGGCEMYPPPPTINGGSLVGVTGQICKSALNCSMKKIINCVKRLIMFKVSFFIVIIIHPFNPGSPLLLERSPLRRISHLKGLISISNSLHRCLRMTLNILSIDSSSRVCWLIFTMLPSLMHVRGTAVVKSEPGD